MICIHFDTIYVNEEEKELAEESKNIINTEVAIREYEINSNQVSGLMVYN